MSKPTIVRFEQMYSDDSGVEFAVGCDTRASDIGGGIGWIEFARCGDVRFPLKKLDWLIDCLIKIRSETGGPNA